MAEPHVITTLAAKHHELAGVIEHHEAKIKKLRGELKTIDGAIKLFDPDYDLRSLKPKQVRSRSKAFKHGEVNRLAMDALRESERPLSTVEIAERIAAGKGLELDGDELKAFQATVLTVLSRQRRKGVLVEDSRDGGVILWRSNLPHRL